MGYVVRGAGGTSLGVFPWS